MWCYKILKPRRPDETDAQVAARLRDDGAAAVEIGREEGIAAAYYPTEGLTNEVAALLIRDPTALPGATRLCWLDKHAGLDVTEGWIARHLAEDLAELDRLHRESRQKSEAASAQRRERFFRS